MNYEVLFKSLNAINQRPPVFSSYTTPELWNDPYLSKQMLALHLNPDAELASRNQAFIEKSVDFICQRFNVTDSSKICDFGCGPGLYTSRLAKKGAQVTGIDFSERSIAHAKQVSDEENLNINYVLADYLQYETENKYNLITMIYCDYCVLNPKQRKLMLDKFYQLLSNDGAIFMDVYSLSHFNNSKEQASANYSPGNDFWSEAPYFALLNNFKYEEEKVLLDKWTVLEENRHREIFNWLQCYSVASLKAEFKASGLEIIETYANVSGEASSDKSTEIALVAKRHT